MGVWTPPLRSKAWGLVSRGMSLAELKYSSDVSELPGALEEEIRHDLQHSVELVCPNALRMHKGPIWQRSHMDEVFCECGRKRDKMWFFWYGP